MLLMKYSKVFERLGRDYSPRIINSIVLKNVMSLFLNFAVYANVLGKM